MSRDRSARSAGRWPESCRGRDPGRSGGSGERPPRAKSLPVSDPLFIDGSFVDLLGTQRASSRQWTGHHSRGAPGSAEADPRGGQNLHYRRRDMTAGEESPQTWHHGIVASWWAEFNVGGPEIPYFRKSSTPYADASLWRHWLKEERQALPKPWRELGEGDRRRGSDGAEYELRSRIVELDPLSQC